MTLIVLCTASYSSPFSYSHILLVALPKPIRRTIIVSDKRYCDFSLHSLLFLVLKYDHRHPTGVLTAVEFVDQCSPIVFGTSLKDLPN